MQMRIPFSFRLLASALLLSLIGFPSSGAAQSFRTLRCEYQNDPVGIEETLPRLSWKIDTEARGWRQSAYQVLVASSAAGLAENKGDLWDSGKCASSNSTHVVYAGAPLQSRLSCYWKVRVWDAADQASAWSSEARWSMGLLQPEDWKAQWIGLERGTPTPEVKKDETPWIWAPEGKPAESAPVGKRYFRRSFSLPEKAVEEAMLMVAGDNNYACYVNGKAVGDGSGWFNFSSFKVTPHLQAGENVLAIQAENSGEASNPAGLIARLELKLAGGEAVALTTDNAWQCSAKRDQGWQKAGFDASAWEAAQTLGVNGMAPWGEVKKQGAGRRYLAARYLRKEFKAEKQIAAARAYICGLGYYTLFLNGKRVGDHELDPILRDYDHRAPYVTYEVGELLAQGDNSICVMLGKWPLLCAPLRRAYQYA